jgi:ribosomal protein S4E
VATKKNDKKKETKKKTIKSTKKTAKHDFAVDTTDDNARIGQFVYVAKGKHEGRYGVLETVVTQDSDNWPETVVVVSRDDNAERIVVDYSDLLPADSGVR